MLIAIYIASGKDNGKKHMDTGGKAFKWPSLSM